MGVTKIPILFIILISLNLLTEYLFNRMMLIMEVLEKKNRIYHILCAMSRVTWLSLCTWFVFSTPVMLIGLFLLLYINVLPYHNRKLLMKNFTMIIYLIFISILMAVIGIAGIFGYEVEYMVQDAGIRLHILNVTFIIFNIVAFLLMRYHPGFLWKDDYDRFKVVMYTRFLQICIIYHLLDSLMLTLYHTSLINFLLLISGDILILILIFNFLNYNYVFKKSECLRKEYEENEIKIAQQYFEKQTLKKLSEYDALTQAYSRREISSIMSERIQNGHKLVCVFIDLDGLKRTNDKYGHTFGDAMLKRFADACMQMLKKDDYLARIGGDEFLLVFPDQDICQIESRIKALQQKLLAPVEEIEKISFSYGISFDEDCVDNYIDAADKRMYECKNRKRSGRL